MLNSNSCRMLFAIAAVSAMAGFSWADCNCSVPPSPAASFGMNPNPSWNGGTNYGMSPGSMSAAAYGGPAYSGPGYGGPGYGGPGYGGPGYGGPGNGGPANGNGGGASDGPYWAPGGYEGRTGSPIYYHDPAGGQYVSTGNPYNDHFGPGFHRNSLYGHYRFPYYNYRAPWYYPGRSVYNRDTNFAW